MASLGYSEYFDKKKTKPTYFKEKILFTVPYMKEVLNSKIHSMRDDVHDLWQPGRTIHHCYGNRTKNRECFWISKCISTQIVEITYTEGYLPLRETIVTIDGRRLKYNEIGELAVNDGFDTVEEFFAWFNTSRKLKLIHWTDKRY